MEAADLEVSKTLSSKVIDMSIIEWKAMVTNKVWSIYIGLSDSEIQEGLAEIDSLFEGKPRMSFSDDFTLFAATPKAS